MTYGWPLSPYLVHLPSTSESTVYISPNPRSLSCVPFAGGRTLELFRRRALDAREEPTRDRGDGSRRLKKLGQEKNWGAQQARHWIPRELRTDGRMDCNWRIAIGAYASIASLVFRILFLSDLPSPYRMWRLSQEVLDRKIVANVPTTTQPPQIRRLFGLAKQHVTTESLQRGLPGRISRSRKCKRTAHIHRGHSIKYDKSVAHVTTSEDRIFRSSTSWFEFFPRKGQLASHISAHCMRMRAQRRTIATSRPICAECWGLAFPSSNYPGPPQKCCRWNRSFRSTTSTTATPANSR